CTGLSYIPRSVWRARPEKPTIINLRIPIPHVFIHHTSSETCYDVESCSSTIRKIQMDHQQTKHDIGYHFLIGGDGQIYEGRVWHYRGFIVDNYNTKSISIAFIGDYTDDIPSENMIAATRNLLRCLSEKNYIKQEFEVHGHRDAESTFCPGDKLYQQIQTWPEYRLID
ncbi:Peptidoglycan-recognition protein SC2-like protein, partial [Dinothrombium tinctorium]